MRIASKQVTASDLYACMHYTMFVHIHFMYCICIYLGTNIN